MSPTATNAVAGSQLIKRANGAVTLMTPEGIIVYEGIPSFDAIMKRLENEPSQIKAAINDWLFKVVGIGDSRFHSMPINTVMLAPKRIPQGKGIGRL